MIIVPYYRSFHSCILFPQLRGTRWVICSLAASPILSQAWPCSLLAHSTSLLSSILHERNQQSLMLLRRLPRPQLSPPAWAPQRLSSLRNFSSNNDDNSEVQSLPLPKPSTSKATWGTHLYGLLFPDETPKRNNYRASEDKSTRPSRVLNARHWNAFSQAQTLWLKTQLGHMCRIESKILSAKASMP